MRWDPHPHRSTSHLLHAGCSTHNTSSNPERPSTALRSASLPSSPSLLYWTSNFVSEALAASAGASAFAPSERSLLKLRLSCTQEREIRVGTDVSGREDGNDGHECMGHELMGWSLGWAGLQRTSVSEVLAASAGASAFAPSGPSLLWLRMSCAQERDKGGHRRERQGR